jgi:hypothetical protein
VYEKGQYKNVAERRGAAARETLCSPAQPDLGSSRAVTLWLCTMLKLLTGLDGIGARIRRVQVAAGEAVWPGRVPVTVLSLSKFVYRLEWQPE